MAEAVINKFKNRETAKVFDYLVEKFPNPAGVPELMRHLQESYNGVTKALKRLEEERYVEFAGERHMFAHITAKGMDAYRSLKGAKL